MTSDLLRWCRTEPGWRACGPPYAASEGRIPVMGRGSKLKRQEYLGPMIDAGSNALPDRQFSIDDDV